MNALLANLSLFSSGGRGQVTTSYYTYILHTFNYSTYGATINPPDPPPAYTDVKKTNITTITTTTTTTTTTTAITIHIDTPTHILDLAHTYIPGPGPH
ncbi:hypothetical protein DFP73DRAFT_144753 [Morchella snyderi]|nr:hypothetical protein DFP73DRAFT_144753 [Morchella snyderi]